MMRKSQVYFPSLPSESTRAQEAIQILSRYWGGGDVFIRALPIPSVNTFPSILPPQMMMVSLPDFAKDCGVDDKLLVPAEWAAKWDQVPWFDVIWWMANGWAERLWEARFGCVHSYSFQLKKWDSRLWGHAWVNRVALFLRRWAAHRLNQTEHALFGYLPKGELLLSHDVDAIRKTGVIRLKQSVFNLFNCVRALFVGNFELALRKLGAAIRFLIAPDDYMGIPQILRMEKENGVRSVFLFYAGKTGWRRSIKALLIDPSYDVNGAELRPLIEEMRSGGWQIGLHPSALSWSDADLIAAQRQSLERATNHTVEIIRQHWLRFSWERTWVAQARAGMSLDLTMGFNDRPGFRNCTALRMSVLMDKEGASKFEAVPMVLMDSHLYDYANLSSEQRFECMEHYINEIKQVGGVATIIWHPHVFGDDYGWEQGYQQLLACWKRNDEPS